MKKFLVWDLLQARKKKEQLQSSSPRAKKQKK
jgi:hypothetical protein